MFAKHSLLLAAVGSALVAAAPSGQRSTPAPCAQISQQYMHDVKTGKVPAFSGALAYECLQSMPFDPRRGAAFVKDVKKYMQWQSNANVLSNPPASYLSPPVDIWGGLDYLQQQAADNKFSNQFEFDTALSDLFISAKDGHLSLVPCSFMPFVFVSHESLVSISSDGLQLPKIYTYNDAQVLKSNPDAISPIVTINGKEVVSHLEGVAETQSFQDPDARYNNVFRSRSRFMNSEEMLGAFSYGPNGMWPGPTVYNLTYANGTTSKSEVKAAVRSGKFKFANGKALYESYCLPAPYTTDTTAKPAPSTATPTPSSSAPASSTPVSQSPSATAKPAPTGYPKAAIRDDNNLIAGYLLREPGLEDTAVLSVPTFSVSSLEGGTDVISSLAVEFIQRAVDAGKKKMIIDLSSNPGGDVNYAFDLFKLFFPNKTPYWSSRFRAHEAFKLIEKVGYSFPHDSENDAFESLVEFGFYNLKTPDQNHTFESAKELYGPHRVLGTNMSTANSLDLDLVSSEAKPIHGFGGIKSKWTTPPFAPEDILIITDGACSSACPTFTKMMKYEGVKTLSFGGRPQHGPMQTMGGTRGAQVLPGSTLVEITSTLLDIAAEKELLSKSELQQLKALSPAEESPLQYGQLQVNLRDAYSKLDEDSSMPLQFVYEPAHCRLFYTLENFLQPATTWSAAVKAMWGGGECVAGSRQK
ncbi:hypothetical protein N7537_004811 [Penicillium hordei]|uniref:Tail specific protease domain-containing protein n=1 Tax=Penicillium hordei TaxID=40994 RepID=A0AAD6EC36_9EURO|nr:uncharacterized protein N7537_004811 [Penicillium hordei]KAJ5608192.1 hypothetical protein N7537_004811 [Penicillium hordei]